MIVARPRAVPIPLPLMAFGPTRLNLIRTKVRRKMTSKKNHSHGGILQHIRYDKKANHTPSNVHLIKLWYTTIASCNCDISQRNVEIILSCKYIRKGKQRDEPSAMGVAKSITFGKLSPIELTCFQFNCDYMSQRFVKEFDWNSQAWSHDVREEQPQVGVFGINQVQTNNIYQ